MMDLLTTLHRGDRYTARSDSTGLRPLFIAKGDSAIHLSHSLVRLREDAAVTGLSPGGLRDAILGDTTRPILQNVRALPPRTSLTFDGESAALKGPDPLPLEVVDATGPHLRTAMLDRLGDAVERQVGDEPAAVLISGGLTDAAVLPFAPVGGLKAWSLSAGLDDRSVLRAIEVAEYFDLPHRIFETALEDLPAAFERAVRATESPISNDLDVARYLLYREMAFEGARRVVVPDGGPELFLAHSAGLASQNGAPPPCLVAHKQLEQVIRLLLKPEWRAVPKAAPAALSLYDARDAAFDQVLPRRLALVGRPVPPGATVCSAYLDPGLLGFVRGLAPDLLSGPGGDMKLLRECLRGELPDEVLSGPAHVSMSVESVRDPAVKRMWTQVYNGLVRPSRLHDLEIFDMENVLKLFRRFDRTDPDDPGLVIFDCALKRLASVSVLADIYRADS